MQDRSPCGSVSSLETFWWILSRWSINTIPHPCTFTAYQVIALHRGLMARPPTRIFHPHSTAVKTPSPDHKSCHTATKQEPPNLKPQPRVSRLGQWPGTETRHFVCHHPSHQDSIPEAERFCDLLRVTPHVTHRAPHTHPQPAVHQSNLRVISIRWGAKVSKDLNLSLLTYNSLLESGYFS